LSLHIRNLNQTHSEELKKLNLSTILRNADDTSYPKTSTSEWQLEKWQLEKQQMERHIEVLESYIDMKEMVTWRDARVAEMDEQSTHTVILEPSTSKLRHLYSYSH
jgi:hypothetical protein